VLIATPFYQPPDSLPLSRAAAGGVGYNRVLGDNYMLNSMNCNANIIVKETISRH